MSPRRTNPMLSVDVVALRFRPAEQPVLRLGIAERLYEPHAGDLALPGVLMVSGERVTEAATRAVESKLGVDAADVRLVLTGQVYDTPDRDERGPTVSIGCLAVVDAEAEGRATWVGFDGLPALPFDHAEIIASTRHWAYGVLWQNAAALGALLGNRFSTTDVAAVDSEMLGHDRNPANVRRDLDALHWIERTKQTVAVGRGRPQVVWAIRQAH